MEVYVKSFATYRTIKKATTVSFSLVLDSLENDASTITVRGTNIDRSDIGSWLVCGGQVFRISNVKPDNSQTQLTLESPLEAFQRPLELEEQPLDQTIGGFIASQLHKHWATCDDPAYVVPYLAVSNSDTTLFVSPDLDNSGSYTLPDYARLMRKAYRVTMLFSDGGDKLNCAVQTAPAATRQISFEDGHSQLENVTYSVSGLAKITALHDVDTGEKDSDGNKIYARERTNWYLAENGEISQLIPARRASGEWGHVYLKGSGDVQTKVVEAFAKNKTDHKLEFWSDKDLPVQTNCSFLVYGQLLHSHISYKRKSSTDDRYFYKSGELATTITEKLKGVIK